MLMTSLKETITSTCALIKRIFSSITIKEEYMQFLKFIMFLEQTPTNNLKIGKTEKGINVFIMPLTTLYQPNDT
jgi:Ca2+-binding EF-hand superfamily protein